MALKNCVLLGGLLTASSAALADWDVNNEASRVSFVSVKNNTVAEAHYFETLSGRLTEDGTFTLDIDLASVKTNIDIRDERMREHLFNTATFQTMTVTANASSLFETLEGASQVVGTLSATISLNGQDKQQDIDVLVAKNPDGGLMVSSLMPVLVNPSDFALQEGIDTLKSLAGLDSITRAVPVSFVLTLDAEQ